MTERAGPVRPAMQRRRTMVRTDSAPCDLSDEASVASLSPPNANAALGARTWSPPQVPSPRSSLNGSHEAKQSSAEERKGVNGITTGLPRVVSEEALHSDLRTSDDTASNYSTASEGQEPPTANAAEKNSSSAAGPSRNVSYPASLRLPAPLPSPQHSLLTAFRSPLSPAGALVSPNPMDYALLSLNLRMFWQWILCICVVTFDLDTGQALECVYPPIDFSEDERKNIAFSAFPDSNSTSHVGDNRFTFRMRSGKFTTELYRKQQPPPLADVSGNSLPASSPASARGSMSGATGVDTLHPGAGLPVDTDGHTYGYVFFRQQRDTQLRRGYFQKSLVILSPHPWPGLFLDLIAKLGPAYMDSLYEDRRSLSMTSDLSSVSVSTVAKTLLETACFDIAAWPPPPSTISSETTYIPIPLSLPFLGTVTQYSFPPNARFAQLIDGPPKGFPGSIEPAAATNCTAGRFYELFDGSLELMWTAWELLLVGQSLLVVADTPQGCSDIIWGLVELLKPIPFGGDFRPYFTIQDSDFKGIANRQRLPTTATILGVTNPVFTKVLEHWPNVLRAAKHMPSSVPAELPQSNAPGAASPRSRLSNPPPTVNTSSPPSKSGILSPFSSKAMKSSPASKTTANRSSPLQKHHRAPAPDGVRIETITCKHKPFLHKDRALIKEVVEAAIRGKPTHILNNMLRRHFMDLTERFIQPLNKYFQTLVVGNLQTMTLSNIRARPEIRPFRQESFLELVDGLTAGTQSFLPVATKRPLKDLYRTFLVSPNFAAWLQHRTEDVFRDWRRRYIAVLCTHDVDAWARERLGDVGRSPSKRSSARRSSGAGDIECVDLILRVRDEVVKYAPYFAAAATPASTPGSQTFSSTASAPPSVPTTPRDATAHTPLRPPPPVARPSISSRGSTAYLDLSTGAADAGWASTLCAAAPAPSSPGPVSVMGGVVPTTAQYAQLKLQLQRLVAVLPDDLRGSVLCMGRGAGAVARK
ncbi:hypothetical protein HDU86_003773 [Geranomyces michiganensis]|nr:hypothetical protein HDU86_003773 [Geranomyces michiganensis]